MAWNNWLKSNEDFIKNLYKKVRASNSDLSYTSIDIWLEKYENDNKFRELIDSKNVEKLEKFIAHQKYAFQCLLEKNPDHQSYASLKGHESKLKNNYYKSETHKAACVNGGYVTQEKYPDIMMNNIQKWRKENPEEYTKQQELNAAAGRRGFDKGRETQKKIKAAQTEAYKQRLHNLVQESDITPCEAFAKYKNEFPEWNDSGCSQMFRRYMLGDSIRWEDTGEKRNRSKVYKKLTK